MDSELYFNKLKKACTIKILFIGKDPYPTNPNGIPFCKPTKELRNKSCSGRYLLKGVGIDIDKYSDSVESSKIFFDLLDKKQIGFLNASNDEPQKKILTEEQKKRFWEINYEIIKKSNCVVTSIGAKKILKQYIDKVDLKKFIKFVILI